MDWELVSGAVLLVVTAIILIVYKARNINENYTAGKGMFKVSDDNLEKDEKLDSADYNYYDKDGKFK